MDWRDYCTRMALRIGPAILIILSFIAILLGFILHAISINEVQYRSPPAQHFDQDVVIGDKPTDLVWFLQVTDLHLSIRGNPERITDFNEFTKTYLDIVKPDAVLVTGDITDALKPGTRFSSGPQLGEWQAYSNAILNSDALNKTHWLDIRGNHDNFNVYRPSDPTTLYRQYSVRGQENARNYMFPLEKNGKTYTFIGVDEVQTPGLKVPFNFLGIVKEEDLKELASFKNAATQAKSQYTVWFAHYPTSSIASPGGGLRNMIDGPYLCGHYHTIGNWVMKMHATQQPGFAEVELGDWKYNRRLRLAAIDHQLFSLVDVGFKQFPIALMTNPKTAEHSMPKYEPTTRIINSTHIRVIAFSNATVKKVEISLDGKASQPMHPSTFPLWTLNWNPKEYSTGLHSAEITVTDSEGKSKSFVQKFSMDNSKDDFSFGAKILLRAYFKTSVMTMFFTIVVICTFPMLILRVVTYRHQDTGLRRHYKGTFLFNYHQLCNIDRFFWPLIIIPIWIAIGPLFIGYMVDEAIGVCFVWGVLIDSNFIHTGITYNVGSIFLLFIHIPITILLTYQVSNSYESYSSAATAPASIINFKLIIHLAITALQLFMGSLLYSAYGLLAFITSFAYLWSLVIYATCWFQCTTIKNMDFAKFNNSSRNAEEQQALTSQRARDDKSSTSDHSTC